MLDLFIGVKDSEVPEINIQRCNPKTSEILQVSFRTA